jgi:hypothetical protein
LYKRIPFRAVVSRDDPSKVELNFDFDLSIRIKEVLDRFVGRTMVNDHMLRSVEIQIADCIERFMNE